MNTLFVEFHRYCPTAPAAHNTPFSSNVLAIRQYGPCIGTVTTGLLPQAWIWVDGAPDIEMVCESYDQVKAMLGGAQV